MTQPAPRTRSTSTDVALIGTFAALLAVFSLIAIPLGAVPVPITLQTFAVLLTGAVLGPRRALWAVGLYIVVGLAGLPVFAGGQGGLAALASPSAGYLLSFPLAAALTGLIVARVRRNGLLARTAVIVGAMIAGTLVIYAAGIPVMAWRAGMTLEAAFAFNALFIPFDGIKLALAAITASSVLRAFPFLSVRPVRSDRRTERVTEPAQTAPDLAETTTP